MMIHRAARSMYFLALSFLLSSCLSGGLGTSVKSLGTTAKTNKPNTDGDTDSFAITLAYRDGSTSTRQVQLQGKQGLDSAKLVNTCGATGASCICSFYTSTSDQSPVSSSSVSLGVDINAYNCTIAGAVAASTYTHVKLKTTDGKKSTGLIPIKTTLALADVIGDLDSKKVRKIQRYSCIRTFFEGNTVSANTVTCSANLNLGVITASYHYYLFTSQSGNNVNDKTLDVAFSSAICQNYNFLNVSCSGSTLDDRYGLYAEAAQPFTKLVTFVAKPDAAPSTATTGYAAEPDASGNCPVGLMKARPWLAQPPSITNGSLGTNPPSTFINNGNLNNQVLEDASAAPSPFVVYRAPNQTPCSAAASSDCSGISLGASAPAVSTTYSQLSPVLCVIPKALLSGI